MRPEPTDLIQSVSRALRVLEQVTQADRPLPVKVIARRCELNLATAYHLVRTLCYEGYLARHPGGSYSAGAKVAERFHELVSSFQHQPTAVAVLRHLAEASGHSAYLGRIAGDRMVITEVVEGPCSPWLEDLQVGLETAAHATAVGKALLTTMSAADRRRMFASQGMRPYTSRTASDLAAFNGELHGLVPGDLVIEHGEFREDVACAGIATEAGEAGAWWAIGVTTRGLDLPERLLAVLRQAAADLGGVTPQAIPHLTALPEGDRSGTAYGRESQAGR
ncbi:MAG TPA: helix-turn-helix domain-containing protein [Streptosporangiaceae bacterium]|nr:helix-turn-helix domain-containing protein [Streptosporangiaceae bacterium]